MTESAFFQLQDDVFVGTSAARSPWSPDHCHAGPVTGLMARATELLLPDHQITRITVDLYRPLPMAGFRVEAEVTRQGRTVVLARSRAVDAAGKICAEAAAAHIAEADIGDPPTWQQPEVARLEGPESATPGNSPFVHSGHDQPGFMHAVELAYPPNSAPGPGAKTLWMRTPPLLPDEVPSPFQRLCPIGDCGNGISHNAPLTEFSFVNSDVTIAMHRKPEGDWLSSSARSHWRPNGTGLSEAIIGDTQGPVATALQTLVIRPVPRHGDAS